MPPQRVAWVGTREASAEDHIFTAMGELTDAFRRRIGEAQLAELGVHGYVPERFFVWGAGPNEQQQAKLERWLGGLSINAKRRRPKGMM